MRGRSAGLADKKLSRLKAETTRLKTESYGGNMRDPKTREAYEKFKTPGYHKIVAERERNKED